MSKAKINTEHFKEKLLKEEARLITELKSVGRINPDNPGDWEATPGEDEGRSADVTDSADNIEQFEQNTAILKELETELKEVRAALDKIKNGTYGLDEKTGETIPEKRLEAYPAARTCN